MSTTKSANVEKIFDLLKDHFKLQTDRELADYIGVDFRTLAAWKSRGKIAKPDIFLNKCRGLSYEWLKTGQGEMFIAEPSTCYEVARVHRLIDPEEEKLLEAMREFPEAREAMEIFLQLSDRKRKIYLGKMLEELENSLHPNRER